MTCTIYVEFLDGREGVCSGVLSHIPSLLDKIRLFCADIRSVDGDIKCCDSLFEVIDMYHDLGINDELNDESCRHDFNEQHIVLDVRELPKD